MASTLPCLFFSRIFFERKDSRQEFQVESVRAYKKDFILKLKGIDSLSQALEWVGQEVFLPEGDLHPLDKGSFYLFQLIGCAVITREGEKVGTIRDIWFIQNNDLLVVMKGSKEILIPFVQSICFEVDLARKEILVDLPEELSELNEI